MTNYAILRETNLQIHVHRIDSNHYAYGREYKETNKNNQSLTHILKIVQHEFSKKPGVPLKKRNTCSIYCFYFN